MYPIKIRRALEPSLICCVADELRGRVNLVMFNHMALPTRFSIEIGRMFHRSYEERRKLKVESIMDRLNSILTTEETNMLKFELQGAGHPYSRDRYRR